MHTFRFLLYVLVLWMIQLIFFLINQYIYLQMDGKFSTNAYNRKKNQYDWFLLRSSSTYNWFNQEKKSISRYNRNLRVESLANFVYLIWVIYARFGKKVSDCTQHILSQTLIIGIFTGPLKQKTLWFCMVKLVQGSLLICTVL